MGNVDEGITRTDIREEFKNSNVYSKEKCKKCFAKFYCSGGCAANSYNFHGNINDAYDIGCELQRKRIECAIMIKAMNESCRYKNRLQSYQSIHGRKSNVLHTGQ